VSERIAVIGAGTMGAGIAQVAGVAGHEVLVFDAATGAAAKAVAAVHERVASLVAKAKLAPVELRVTAMETVADLGGCDIVIEAVVEDLDVKRDLFAALEAVVSPDAVLATNTSSLSPTAIAARLDHPDRLVGLHFFNPVPLMRLVEVVRGLATDEAVADRVAALVSAWGKTVVRAAPTPGFIVNRLARPFYAEAWRLYEERAALPEVIDAVLVGAVGFRMGPFALMDLIGHDVNEAVTRSVWEGFGYDPRFAPSQAQRALVEAGWLGRKTGRGVYSGTAPSAVPEAPSPGPEGLRVRGLADLGEIDLPDGALLTRSTGTTATARAASLGRPVVVVDRTLEDSSATCVAVAVSDGCPDRDRDAAVGLLQSAGLDVYVVDDVPGLIVTRTVAMLANLAADALHRGVSSAADLDTAMRLGTNYPLGPLAWAQRWGLPTMVEILDALLRQEGDPRYRADTLLRRHALSGRSLT
jgi:3-hydroxybutyryl-CoA dehydrogenase